MLVAVIFIASQTPWFRDWLRRTIAREAKQYLNGELTIGSLGGNLFYGISLSDVAVDVSGERIIAIKSLTVDYNFLTFFSPGIVVDSIALDTPQVQMRRDAAGWNLAKLVKRERREANREGPNRSVSLPAIVINDGTFVIDDRTGSTAYKLPRRMDDVDVKARFDYEPVHFTIGLDNLSFRATTPDLTMNRLTGAFAVRDDNLYIEKLAFETSESQLNVEGVIEHYLGARVIKLVNVGTVSLPEVGRFLPVMAGYDLHPTLVIKTDGRADSMALDLDLKTEAGIARGKIAVDLVAPDVRFWGISPLHIEKVNLGPILKSPTTKTEITGDVKFDVRIASAPANVSALDRMTAGFEFKGSRVVALGYQAVSVVASGAMKGPQVNLAAAQADAYGGFARTQGIILLPGGDRVITYDLKGEASHVNLLRLPAITRAPRLETDLNVAAYHVTGKGTTVRATATLHESIVEGARLADQTIVDIDSQPRSLTYGGKGSVTDLDVRRLGKALQIATLDDARYDGRVNGAFDIKGSGTSLKELNLTANGTLNDTTLMGTHTDNLAFDTQIANAGLTVRAKGDFDHLNPAVITGREDVDGNVNGTVDATFRIADLTAPMTPASVAADGHVTLGPSLIHAVQIAAADVQGRYENEVADLQKAQVKGPDVTLDATGRLALDRTSQSNLKYHIASSDITEVGRLAGQDGLDGAVVLDGTVTGNAASLHTSGTLDGSGLAYGENKSLDLNSTYSATVPDLDFVNAKVEATTDGTFVSIGRFQINKLTAKTTYAQKRLEFQTTLQERTREVDARGSVVFHPDHQEFHLPQMTLRTQGVEWTSAPGSEAAVQYGQGLVTFQNVRFTSTGDQSLEVAGSIVVQGEKPSGQLAVRARNVDIAQAETLLLQNRGFTGKLTADATIAGTLAKPQIDGTLDIRDGGFRNYKYQSLVATVGYGGPRLLLDATLQQSPDVSITAKGTVPMSAFEQSAGDHVAPTPDDMFDLRVQSSSINLAVVQGFTTFLANVGGTLQADVKVTGSGRDPHLEGFMEIRDGTFGVPRFGTSYSGLDTRIDLQPDRITIRRFEILDENGEQLAVAGQLGVHERQVGSVDITLDSTNFEVIDNELGDVGVGAHIKIGGEIARPRIEGDVRVTAGRLEVDKIAQLFYDPYRVEALPDIISAESRVESAGGAEEAARTALRQAQSGVQLEPVPQLAPAKEETPASTGLFDRVGMNVRVRIPDNLVLRGRRIRPGGPTSASLGDMNITVGGDLDIRKEAGSPITLAGVVNTVRGTYQFQGRQFELTRDGSIRFTGEQELNPVLDVAATRQIPETGVEVRVRITGTAKVPELTLTSTPPLDESDILSLILFNRSINDLGTGERASVAAAAGGIASGFIATPLGESIGRALNLDLFEITTSSEGDTIGAGITVGQQIGERTFVKLRQQFGDRAYTEFLAEYRLTDFLRLAASAAPETSNSGNRLGQRRIERAGIDLIFFFSY
jgi:autotransporter translocation and assembly factor TamB